MIKKKLLICYSNELGQKIIDVLKKKYDLKIFTTSKNYNKKYIFIKDKYDFEIKLQKEKNYYDFIILTCCRGGRCCDERHRFVPRRRVETRAQGGKQLVANQLVPARVDGVGVLKRVEVGATVTGVVVQLLAQQRGRC